MPTGIYLVKVGMFITEGMVAEWDGAEVQAVPYGHRARHVRRRLFTLRQS